MSTPAAGAPPPLPPYTVTFKNEGEDADVEKKEALELCQKFVLSIMNATVDPILNVDGTRSNMRVVRQVFKLETRADRDIILRSMTEQFWQVCIDAVNTPDLRVRVAAVGTPGIGKTTSTPWLIRMLLERGQTVVYLIRTESKSKWYYEFIPDNLNRRITVDVYPETIAEHKIPSLKLSTSYYIVDPGKSKDNCDPSSEFAAKVILVPSPDSGHWGGSEFEKERDDLSGEFRYFPTWSLEELLLARPILRNNMTEDEVRDRFRQFGGVPRHIFGRKVGGMLQAQNDAVAALTFDQAKKIALGQVNALDSFDPETKSAVLAFRLSREDTGTFEKRETYIVSARAFEKIYAMHQRRLRSGMSTSGR